MDDQAAGGFQEHLEEVLIGGPEPVSINVVNYDPAWAERFSTERNKIAAALGAQAGSIEHIGSTAVPGLAAKPIVDIMVTVGDVELEGAYRPQLEKVGYVLRVREAGHRMFRTPGRDVHIHLFRAGADEVARHLVFRDRLRVSADDQAEYQAVKLSLAERQWPDMNYYARAKDAVIASILARAAAARR